MRCGGIGDQGRRHAQFQAAELVVDGLVADGQGLLFVSGQDAGLDAQHHGGHQFDHLGEQQLLLVLPLGGLAKQGIESVGVKQALQGQACQDTEGRFLHDGVKGSWNHGYPSQAYYVTTNKVIV